MTQSGADTTAPELDKDQVAPEDLEDFALQDDYALNPQYVERVIDAADRGDEEHLRELAEARVCGATDSSTSSRMLVSSSVRISARSPGASSGISASR